MQMDPSCSALRPFAASSPVKVVAGAPAASPYLMMPVFVHHPRQTGNAAHSSLAAWQLLLLSNVYVCFDAACGSDCTITVANNAAAQETGSKCCRRSATDCTCLLASPCSSRRCTSLSRRAEEEGT